MFDHVEYTVSDVALARGIYGPMCQAIGCKEAFYEPGVDLGIADGGIVRFLLTQGDAVTPAMHICFAAPSTATVDQAYKAAIAGGATCNGKPGLRPDYGAGYYAAFVRDSDGHNVEILCRAP